MLKVGQNRQRSMMQEWKLINYIKMSDIEFIYIPRSPEKSDAFRAIQEKHRKEMSSYSDIDYINEIFNYLSCTFNNLSVIEKNTLRLQKEKEITDDIRRKLQNNSDFELNGFKVDTEARNQSMTVGYYDLKFQHSYWIGKYFVFECKLLDLTNYRINEYLYKKTTQDEDGGLYRFLINKYAENLPFGGMLGYIISNTPEKVITKLKTKIKSFQIENDILNFGNLTDEHLLNIQIQNFNRSFQSKHIRINQNKEKITPIHIFHVFLDLTE
jgi:hypothetical protein